MNIKNQKVEKDRNLITRSRLLVNTIRCLPIWILIGLVTFGLYGLLLAVPASFASAVLVEILSGALGTASAKFLYGTGKRDRNSRDQFTGTLNQIRYHKMREDYDKALFTINDVLAKDPDFPEALLLKARILWQGYGNAAGAKQCILQLIKAEPEKNEPFHRWGLTLYKEIVTAESIKNIGNGMKTL